MAKITIEAHPVVLLILGFAGLVLASRRRQVGYAAATSMTPRGEAPTWLVRVATAGPLMFGIMFALIGFGGALYSFFD